MALTLTPIATLLDRGEGVQDLQGALASVGAETELNFANDGNLILFIENGDVAAKTATLAAQPDPFGRGGGGVNDEPITIPAGQVGFFPFMSPAMFNNVGITTVTLSAATNVNVGLYRLSKRT